MRTPGHAQRTMEGAPHRVRRPETASSRDRFLTVISRRWLGLFNSYYWIDRKAGIAAVIATQLLPFFYGKMVETSLGFEAMVYAELGAAVG